MPATATLSRWQAWLVAIRPATLPAAVGPVLVGLAVAISLGVFEVLPALAALAVALLLQIASNVGNDLSDHRSGVDTEERLGPTRAAACRPAQRARDAGRAGSSSWGWPGWSGCTSCRSAAWSSSCSGIAAVVSAFAYSGGPWPYGYHGLGEVFVFVFFGLVAVAGTTYLQTLTWEPLALVAAIPVGALITAILVINNLRDIDTDERTGKRTLAVMLGERGAMAEYDLLLGVAYAVPVALLIAGDVTPGRRSCRWPACP